MNSQLLQIFKDSYQPLAIILHGSQARGDSLPSSDFDVYVVVSNVKEASQKRLREFQGSNLDIEFLSKDEVLEADINEFFGYNLFDAKILFDTDTIGSHLLSRAHVLYSNGRNLKVDERESREFYYKRALARLRDCVGDPISFEIRFGDLYARLPRYWAELKNNSWGKSIRILEKEIQAKDSFFFEILEQLVEVRREEKVMILEKVYNYLFVDLDMKN